MCERLSYTPIKRLTILFCWTNRPRIRYGGGIGLRSWGCLIFFWNFYKLIKFWHFYFWAPKFMKKNKECIILFWKKIKESISVVPFLVIVKRISNFIVSLCSMPCTIQSSVYKAILIIPSIKYKVYNFLQNLDRKRYPKLHQIIHDFTLLCLAP